MKQITVFSLDGCLFGIENAYIDVILPPTALTAVPQRRAQLFRGTMPLQDGRLIHVINTAGLLGMEPAPRNERTRVIVLRMNGLLAGLVVDAIDRVTEIDDGEITKQLPLSKIESKFLAGIVSTRQNSVIILLDMDAVLAVLNPG